MKIDFKALCAAGFVLLAAACGKQQPPHWNESGPLVEWRMLHSATLLQSGEVLIAGGFDGWNSIASAETYDPATGRFRMTGSLLTERFGHTATLLPNGLVLVAGGMVGQGGVISSTAELYDPDTGAWYPTGTMNAPRMSHAATLLRSGKVLVTGDG